MKIGDKIFYNGEEFTVWLIEGDIIHAENERVGICINKNDI